MAFEINSKLYGQKDQIISALLLPQQFVHWACSYVEFQFCKSFIVCTFSRVTNKF